MSAGNQIPGRRATPSPATPRWVKAFALIGGIILVAFAVLHLTGKISTMHGGQPTMEPMVTTP